MEDRETELTFTREFGRTLTFLYRSRAKYMGERLREYGFAGAMFMILLHVDRHPGVSQDRIANHLYIDKCNVARRTKNWRSWATSTGRPTPTTAARTNST